MQIGSVPVSHTPSITLQQGAAPQGAPPPGAPPPHGKDRDGDHDGSTSATADSSTGKQVNLVA